MAGNSFLGRWARLYTAPTRAELAAEAAVCKLGVPYRAQHPVFAAWAVLDFAVFPAGLGPDGKAPGIALEIDGASHRTAKARAKDAERTAKLEARGWKVVRVTNEEILADAEAAIRGALFPFTKVS